MSLLTLVNFSKHGSGVHRPCLHLLVLALLADDGLSSLLAKGAYDQGRGVLELSEVLDRWRVGRCCGIDDGLGAILVRHNWFRGADAEGVC